MFSMNTRPMTLTTPTETAVAGAREIAAVAGRAGGVVRRPQQARLDADVVERLFLVPDVIAGGHHVDAAVEQLLADLARDAEAGGRVLGVGDDEIDAVVVDDRLQSLAHELASGTPDDVADEKDAHGPQLTAIGCQLSAVRLKADASDEPS